MLHVITTRTDLIDYVETTLGEFVDDFDVDRIVDTLQSGIVVYGVTTSHHLDLMPTYWDVIGTCALTSSL